MDNKTDDLNFKVSIEDGYCLFEFFNELSIENILSSEAQVINLMNAHKVDILPFIADLSKIDDQEVKIEVRDFGKMISSRALFERCSGVWIVGAKGYTKMLTGLLNKTFLGNRLKLVDTVEEAKAAIKNTKQSKIPMLEQDVE